MLKKIKSLFKCKHRELYVRVVSYSMIYGYEYKCTKCGKRVNFDDIN